jgi:hypothetical protein
MLTDLALALQLVLARQTPEGREIFDRLLERANAGRATTATRRAA